jgi:methylated-DNA-[protein]-cysteine S-methyltransferase
VATDLRWITVPTPLGDLTVIASEAGVVATAFREDAEATLEEVERRLGARARPSARTLAGVMTEVAGYFGGETRTFATPVDLALATPGFRRRVLEVTATIPYGELWTYGDVAAMAGAPRAARAAGTALARCPIELFVPCHRVVHAGRGLGGYGRFTERKRWLIAHERDARVRVGEDGGT